MAALRFDPLIDWLIEDRKIKWIGADLASIDHSLYTRVRWMRPDLVKEFEVMTGQPIEETLPERDFEWSSRFQTMVKVNETSQTWNCEMRIPLKALSETMPAAGVRWRINFYRCDRANKAFLAWSPTLTGGFHEPEKFGLLEFVK